eukprot:2318785-Pleurochrysis_carterae.AAC.1
MTPISNSCSDEVASKLAPVDADSAFLGKGRDNCFRDSDDGAPRGAMGGRPCEDAASIERCGGGDAAGAESVAAVAETWLRVSLTTPGRLSA